MNNITSPTELPFELFFHTSSFLPIKTLAKWREVNSQEKAKIDYLAAHILKSVYKLDATQVPPFQRLAAIFIAAQQQGIANIPNLKAAGLLAPIQSKFEAIFSPPKPKSTLLADKKSIEISKDRIESVSRFKIFVDITHCATIQAECEILGIQLLFCWPANKNPASQINQDYTQLCSEAEANALIDVTPGSLYQEQLTASIAANHTDAVQKFLEKSPQWQPSAKQMHLAIFSSLEMFTILWARADKSKHYCYKGESLLHSAVFHGQDAICALLAEHNYDATIRNNCGATAQQLTKTELMAQLMSQYIHIGNTLRSAFTE